MEIKSLAAPTPVTCAVGAWLMPVEVDGASKFKVILRNGQEEKFFDSLLEAQNCIKNFLFQGVEDAVSEVTEETLNKGPAVPV